MKSAHERTQSAKIARRAFGIGNGGLGAGVSGYVNRNMLLKTA
jgi:hypothetical protein